MIFKGSNTRLLTGQKNISFLLSKSSVNNTTGSVHFGFSGEGESIQFIFKKGRIYDFNNKYVHSYSPSEEFILSGDISGDYYNYSINGVDIVTGKNKKNFKIENFFINTDSCELEASLFIYSDGIDHTFTLPDKMLRGDNVIAQMTNNSPDGNLHIYSATLKGETDTNYSVVLYPTDIGPTETGNFEFSNLDLSSGNNSFEMELDTNVGKIYIADSIQVTDPEQVSAINTLEELTTNASEVLTFDTINSEEFVYYVYRSSIFAASYTPQEVVVSLGYEEGNVGTYHRVTEISITDSGTGYTEAPIITFSAGQGNDVQAEGIAVITDGGVSSVTIENSGVYYNAAPTMSFSGGAPDPYTITPAQFSVTTETYEKTFTECFAIATGIAYESLTSYDSLAHLNEGPIGPYYSSITPTSLFSDQNFYIRIKGKTFYDFDTIKAKLTIAGTLEDSNTNRQIEEIIISSGNTAA